MLPLERTLTAEEVKISSSSCELVIFKPKSLISALDIVIPTPLFCASIITPSFNSLR